MEEVRQLIFVDDRPCSACRPCSLNYALFERSDVKVILLRVQDEALGGEYLALTENIPQFYVDPAAPLDGEITRFKDWCAAQGLAPAHFCCMSEPRQEYWQSFGRALGLNALPADVIHALRYKPAMKDWIRRCGFETAEYGLAGNADDVKLFGERYGYPLIIKPVDGWGTLATHIVTSAEAVAGHAALLSSRAMMVETFVPDTEYECCALIANGKVLDIFPSIMPAAPVDIARGALNANLSVGRHRDWIPAHDLHGIVQKEREERLAMGLCPICGLGIEDDDARCANCDHRLSPLRQA